ncbi:hypothetical protein IWX50DRAFT_344049 [Phyllosticta citricarpa]
MKWNNQKSKKRKKPSVPRLLFPPFCLPSLLSDLRIASVNRGRFCDFQDQIETPPDFNIPYTSFSDCCAATSLARTWFMRLSTFQCAFDNCRTNSSNYARYDVMTRRCAVGQLGQVIDFPSSRHVPTHSSKPSFKLLVLSKYFHSLYTEDAIDYKPARYNHTPRSKFSVIAN